MNKGYSLVEEETGQGKKKTEDREARKTVEDVARLVVAEGSFQTFTLAT